MTPILKILKKPPTYRTMLNHIKAIHPDLSVHSIRKGSMHFLSEKGVSEDDILTLTQHASRNAPLQARRYLNNAFSTKTEARKQLQLSMMLNEAIYRK